MKHLVFPAIALLLLAQPLPAEEAEHGQAGYEDMPEFGGPESVTEQLKRADELREAPYDWPFFDGYFDWKRQVDDDYGVSFGLHFYGLYQKANNSLPGRDDDAMGNIFRFLGNWTVFEKDNGNLGRIEWRLESRSDWFGLQAPGSLGSATGIAALAPGFAYSDNFEMDLSVINWTQGFANGKAGYAVGRLGFDVYLDAFPFQTFSRGFINRSFILNPTLPTTGIGALGGVVKGFVTDNVWLGAQIHDANAVSGKFDFDTVQEGEWLKAVEVGYTPSFGQRKSHLVQFTYWDKDARSLAGVSSGSGWAVSAAWKLNDTYFPFVRIGHSDGGGGVAAETAVSGGVEISRPRGEVWTIGAGWAKPSEETFGPGLDNETALEMSYKFPISKNLSILPDAQIIFSPANNPGRTSIWVIGVRAILTL
ncbi:MAG: carbohydrate porin [Gammaproteobacteria bacterium]|jgi:porin|nr:carbohydrate porin [Gammaproteobacteria bacterium]